MARIVRCTFSRTIHLAARRRWDFTHCTELGVTIGGEPFRHLLFHLVLSHSGWRYAEVCFGETFGALVQGLQGALWELGGVPRVVRTDNLSAAHTRPEEQQWPCRERQVRGCTDPLRGGVHQDQPTLLARERRCRAGTQTSEERLGPGADPQGQPRLRVRGRVQTVRQRSRRSAKQAGETRSSRRSVVTCGRFRQLRSRSTPTTVAGCAGGARSGWLTGHTRCHHG